MATILSSKTTGGGGASITGDTSGILQLASADGTTAVTIDASQNVGIGTSSPAKLLDVAGVMRVAVSASTADVTGKSDNTGGINLYGGGAYNGGAGIILTGSSNATPNITQFMRGSFTESMRIDASGNVLVGTTSSASGVTGNSEFRASVNNGGAGVLTAFNTSLSAADGSPPITVYKSMTTTSSSARFIQFYANAGSTAMGGIVGNGASNVQFAAISDAREKTNIQPITGSLDKVLALKPSSFDWIADGSHISAGFIAQEVQTIFPEFVVDNMANEGQEQRFGLTGGMTGGIIPHLVLAIQELKAIIDQQATRISALEAK